MICGRIILRIITEYIAYYHIAELYAHASIVSTYVGLERCVKYFIENAKITVMWVTAGLHNKLLKPLAQGAIRFEKLLARKKSYWPEKITGLNF